MRPQNMTKIITAALVAGVLATTPVRACDHAIVLFNWKPCAVGLLGENGEDADWAAVPAWTKNPAIRPYFFDDPRLLAVLGNTKYHRATLCLPGWQKADDKNAY